MNLLPTFHSKYAVSWPPEGERKPSRAHYLPAVDLFELQHQSDVHFAAYNSNKLCRLKSEAVGKAGWAMVAFVVDVDAPKDVSQTEIDAWFELEKPKIARVLSNLGVAYRSKSGGYRLIWWLEKPYQITSPHNLNVWRKNYLLALLALYSRFGIVADPKCGDATRIFRAPRVRLDDGKTTQGTHLCQMSEKTLPRGLFSPSNHEIETGKGLAKLSQAWREALAWLFPVQPEPPSMPPQQRPSSNESAPILLRAEKYLQGMPPSISGAGGQKALWNAAFALTKGFGLSEQDAMFLLERSFNPKCKPAWSKKELERTAQRSKLSNKNEGWLLQAAHHY